MKGIFEGKPSADQDCKGLAFRLGLKYPKVSQLAQAQKIDMGDNRQKKDIDAGVDMATLAATQYK